MCEECLSRLFNSLVVDGFWDIDNNSVQIFLHLDLAAEPGCFCETKGQVQHVQLLICGLLQFLLVLFREYEVASGAGQRSLASTKPRLQLVHKLVVHHHV